MPRAIWSGSISFGLLNVPVKLYSAVSKQTVRFRELREKDGSRVRHKRVAEADGKEVAYDDIVKGYEFAPDQYVTLTRDELAELDPKKTRAIEIQDFVDLDEIDPIYFEHPYYLGPDKGAEKAYALLVEAMKRVAQGRDRALRAPQQGEPRRDPADGRRADDGDDALRRRGHRSQGPARRAVRGEAEEAREARAGDGHAADRLPLDRLRRRQVPRRVPRGAAGRCWSRRRRARRSSARPARSPSPPRRRT